MLEKETIILYLLNYMKRIGEVMILSQITVTMKQHLFITNQTNKQTNKTRPVTLQVIANICPIVTELLNFFSYNFCSSNP